VAEFVVDTNVWIMVDRPIASVQTAAELDCIQACRQWLSEFMSSDDKLVLDISHQMLQEYRTNIAPNGRARQWLNQLEKQPRDLRLVEVKIEFDENGYAKIPPEVEVKDKNDRKFVAVALARSPIPPIINATDSDWSQEKERLGAADIVVTELCPDQIQETETG
jgi:hypothetical protein